MKKKPIKKKKDATSEDIKTGEMRLISFALIMFFRKKKQDLLLRNLETPSE